MAAASSTRSRPLTRPHMPMSGGFALRAYRRSAILSDMHSDQLTAGALLRQARQRAGLSQVELAARAGVTQSVISSYESGHRQPSVPTLAAMIEAAGFELVTAVRRQPRRLSRLSGPVGQRVRRRRHDPVAAPAAPRGSRLRVFGS